MRIGWWKWNRKAAALVVFAALALAGPTPVATQEKAYPELDPQMQQLKNQFNADLGKVRVVLIMDPT